MLIDDSPHCKCKRWSWSCNRTIQITHVDLRTRNVPHNMILYSDSWLSNFVGNKNLIRAIVALRKHAYSNILKILPPKNENFQIKILILFHISAQNIDYGYSLELSQWGSSNKHPQSMFLSRNKKNNVYPCEPQFYYIKVGFKGVNII